MNFGERRAGTSSLWEHSLLQEQNCTTSIKHVCLKHTPGVVVSIVTRLRWTSQESWFDYRQGHEIFFFPSSKRRDRALVPTHSLIQRLRSYLFPCVRPMGREVDHSPSSNAEVKNGWNCTSIALYAFMAYTATVSPSGLPRVTSVT